MVIIYLLPARELKGMDNENDLKYFNRMCRLIRVGFKPGSDMYGGYWKYGRRKIYDRWVHECPNKDFNDELFAFGY